MLIPSSRNGNRLCIFRKFRKLPSKENDIPKDILEKISNDTVLKYKDGKYVIEEEITQRFFDSLVGIKEYVDIQKKFTQESNILQNSPDTIYKIQERNEKYTIVTYEKNGICTIKVPNELIPYWSKKREYLKYNEWLKLKFKFIQKIPYTL